MSDTDEGWNSIRCTQKWCRTVVDYGAGHQVLVTGPDGAQEEHRFCLKHWTEYAAPWNADKEGASE